MREILETLAAFKDASRGTILVGIMREGTVAGVTIGANTLEQFANEIRTHTSPPLYPTIEQIELDGRVVVEVCIDSGGPGSVTRAYGRAFVREGLHALRAEARLDPAPRRCCVTVCTQ